MRVKLETKNGESYKLISTYTTNEDGRVKDFPKIAAGVHRLTFDTSAYFKSQNSACFYPKVKVEFVVASPSHYHVPLLVSPYGYSTYRGS